MPHQETAKVEVPSGVIKEMIKADITERYFVLKNTKGVEARHHVRVDRVRAESGCYILSGEILHEDNSSSVISFSAKAEDVELLPAVELVYVPIAVSEQLRLPLE